MRDMLGNEAINLPAEGEVEIWKPVEGWSRYEISSFGRVRNVVKGNILMPILESSFIQKRKWPNCKKRLAYWTFSLPSLLG